MRQIALLLAVLVLLGSAVYGSEEPQESNVETRYEELERKVAHLERELALTNQIKDERLQTLYDLLRLFGIVAGAILVILSIREVLQRRAEVNRQVQIDDIVKELVGFQKTTLQQQNEFGAKFLGQADESLRGQTSGLKSVNEVIGVVQQTLKFRLEQEQNVANALKVGREVQEAYAARDRSRYERALDLAQGFKSLSRMQYPSMPDELYKRGSRLRDMVEDLQDSMAAVGDPIDVGFLYCTSGILAFYDNDISGCDRYLELSAKTRVDNHSDELETNTDYRYRVSFTHFYRALLEKNWGNLEKAQQEISRAHELLKDNAAEFLTPVTRAEILSYSPGQEERCRKEISGLLQKIAGIEASAEHGKLDANQANLRVRMLILSGNTHYVVGQNEAALEYYSRAFEYAPGNVYVLSSRAIVLDALKKTDEARDVHKSCLENIERSSVLTQKREFGTRVLLDLTAAISARGCSNAPAAREHAGRLLELLRTDVTLNGRTPKFFSPRTKRLVGADEVRKEAEATMLEVGSG